MAGRADVPFAVHAQNLHGHLGLFVAWILMDADPSLGMPLPHPPLGFGWMGVDLDLGAVCDDTSYVGCM